MFTIGKTSRSLLFVSLMNLSATASVFGDSLHPQRAAATSPMSTHYQSASSQEIDDYIQILGHINGASIAEPAGSHGSYGTFVGLGVQRTNLVEPSMLLDENLTGTTDSSMPIRSMMVPRLYLTRGLPIPLDITLNAANISSKVNQFGAAAQVTLFQRINWPALAIRGSYGELMGIPQTTFATGSFAAVASYSLLSYFTLFCEAAQSQHWVNIRPYQENTYTYLRLTENNGPSSLSTSRNEGRVAIGLQIALSTSDLFLTVQWERDSYRDPSHTAKFTFMF